MKMPSESLSPRRRRHRPRATTAAIATLRARLQTAIRVRTIFRSAHAKPSSLLCSFIFVVLQGRFLKRVFADLKIGTARARYPRRPRRRIPEYAEPTAASDTFYKRTRCWNPRPVNSFGKKCNLFEIFRFAVPRRRC